MVKDGGRKSTNLEETEFIFYFHEEQNKDDEGLLLSLYLLFSAAFDCVFQCFFLVVLYHIKEAGPQLPQPVRKNPAFPQKPPHLQKPERFQ